MKNYYKNILLSVSVTGLLVACGNGGPSKRDAEDIYNSNAKRTYIKVTDLRCDPAEHGSFSCFIAYQRYRQEALAIEGREEIDGEKKALEDKNREELALQKEDTKAIKWLEEAWKKKHNGEAIDVLEFLSPSYYLDNMFVANHLYSIRVANRRCSFERLEGCLEVLFRDRKYYNFSLKEENEIFQDMLKALKDDLAKIHDKIQDGLKELKKLELDKKNVKKGTSYGSIIQNEQANFTKVNGNWETDAFQEIL